MATFMAAPALYIETLVLQPRKWIFLSTNFTVTANTSTGTYIWRVCGMVLLYLQKTGYCMGNLNCLKEEIPLISAPIALTSIHLQQVISPTNSEPLLMYSIVLYFHKKKKSMTYM